MIPKEEDAFAIKKSGRFLQTNEKHEESEGKDADKCRVVQRTLQRIRAGIISRLEIHSAPPAYNK
jgi:hypothetical protein